MSRCPITYEPLADGVMYSPAGLRLLHQNLQSLAPLEFTAEQQRQEAIDRVGKMSIQGMQPKLSAVLRVTQGRFEIVDQNGRFILKPQSLDYPELPQNEDLTMRLAAQVDIETPVHGLLRSADQSFTYFIKRFDRQPRGKLPVEDFAQLSGAIRQVKIDLQGSVIGAEPVHCSDCAPIAEDVRAIEFVLARAMMDEHFMR